MEYKTILELFEKAAIENKRSDILNYRVENVWKNISTDELSDNVKKLAAGLHILGVKPGDRIGIISNPSPFWVMADHAVIMSGCVTVPIFRRISPENLSFEIEDSGLKILFIGDKDEFDPVMKTGKGLNKIITMGFDRNDGISISFDKLIETGRDALDKNPGLQGLLHRPGPDDLATIIYTSGSTGVPKGVMLTHSNIISQVKSVYKIFDLTKERDIALTSLPLSHIFERMVMYYYLSTGVPIFFVDDLNNIGALIRDVRPTIMTVVPRLLEKVYLKMKNTVSEYHGIKRIIGMAAFHRAETKDPLKPYRGLLDLIYRKLVIHKLNAALGGRFRYVISGAAALSKDINRFFLNLGLPIYEWYGMTEASPVIAVNYIWHNKPGTVGMPFPGVEVKIGPDGEILAKGPNVMPGYNKNEAETKN